MSRLYRCFRLSDIRDERGHLRAARRSSGHRSTVSTGNSTVQNKDVRRKLRKQDTVRRQRQKTAGGLVRQQPSSGSSYG